MPISGKFAVSQIMELSDESQSLLNTNEKKELSSFKNKRRKKEYVTSRLILKELAREMGVKNNEFVILKDELGRPGGKCGSAEYYVSIAHTQNNVFCGITRSTTIGVDIEPVNRAVPEKLKHRILHSNEAQAVREMEAIRLWTIKEAVIKLEGQGLRMNMNEVEVQQEKNGFFVEINNDKTAKICSFQTQDNWLAVAYYQ